MIHFILILFGLGTLVAVGAIIWHCISNIHR